ncbi:dihydrofolate reductase [Azohydromonas aeria]|uniref:dihydrofolate reductase n=1 Tax=Azohydromonas aeria TaxID=2590212 RepID=UPI0012F8E2B9|nr:dihydrofolate reductase [Azohydromonas aeria]
MKLILVAAMARNGVIGRDNAMPWRLPEDLQHFRALTMGAPVVMGRLTWDSLPARFKPLPGRRNVVVTRNPEWRADGAEAAHSLQEALQRLADAPAVFVTGGAQLYAQALAFADELVLTEIDRDFEGDTRFPDFDRNRFAEVARETHRAAPPNDFDFAFVTYRRRG